MIRIEVAFTKFNKLKTKLENNSIDNLTKLEDQSILLILKNNRKNITFPFQKKEKKFINKQVNIENNPISKSKEKKFLTRKITEQNNQNNQNSQNNNNISKEKSPINISKTTNNTNNSVNNHNQNQLKGFQQSNSYKTNNINTPANINLLEIENGDIKYQDVVKIFEEGRNEEEKKRQMEEKNKKIEQNEEKNKKIEQNEEKNKNISEEENEDDSSFFDENITNIEKKTMNYFHYFISNFFIKF